MGKNHRHKKELKSEKAKIKLKQVKTKFLPKGLNVTDTTFKVKPIVLAEQLKQRNDGDILSKRKLNVKDLLTRIKHYNENVRHLACVELAEVIQSHTEEIVQQYLSQICLAVSYLMQDKEKKVRRAAVKCTQVILECVDKTKLSSFFDYFSTNLKCAMTNIAKDVQEDSLLFFDCFIEKDCGFICKTSDKLLPDFLSLISTLRSDSHFGRTLSLNLGSKMTSVAWRIKVLSRLHAVLNIMLCQDELNENQKKFIDGNGSGDPSSGLFKTKFSALLDECDFDLILSSDTSFNHNLQTFSQHIMAIVPLLHETWLEVMPEENVKKQSEGTILNEQNAALLSCIMNILYLLWQYVKQKQNEDINLDSVFLNYECKKFMDRLLGDFPYSQLGVRMKKNKDSNLKILDYNNDAKCTRENILICYLYSVFHMKNPKESLKKNMYYIITYMTKLLMKKQGLGDEAMTYLIGFLKECFQNNYKDWRTSGVNLELILENAISFYGCGKLTQKHKIELFTILTNILDNQNLNKSKKYQNWLKELPNLLLQNDITDITVQELLQISKRNCCDFYSALIDKLPAILDNLHKLNIVLTSDSPFLTKEVVKNNLVNVFYYVPNINRLKLIEDYLLTDNSSDFPHYFTQMLNLRMDFHRY